MLRDAELECEFISPSGNSNVRNPSWEMKETLRQKELGWGGGNGRKMKEEEEWKEWVIVCE